MRDKKAPRKLNGRPKAVTQSGDNYLVLTLFHGIYHVRRFAKVDKKSGNVGDLVYKYSMMHVMGIWEESQDLHSQQSWKNNCHCILSNILKNLTNAQNLKIDDFFAVLSHDNIPLERIGY